MVVDEDCGIAQSLVDGYQIYSEVGPLAHTDQKTVLSSMSEFDKAQEYVYGKFIPYQRWVRNHLAV